MVAKSYRSTNRVLKWIPLVILAVFLLLMLMPFILVTINAVKTEPEFAQFGPLSLPHSINLTSLKDFWTRVNFSKTLFNSTFISLSVAVLAVILSLLNAFALGLGKVKGKAWLLVFFLMANFLPQEALAYPLYYFAKFLHIYDTPYAVILVLTVIQSAFGTYLLSSVFSSFPREILEAAMMDGCNKLNLLWDIVAAQPADPFRFVCVLLHLDMERILPALDPFALECEPDCAAGPGHESGTIWDEYHRPKRLRITWNPALHYFLPALPADADKGNYRRRH